MTIQRGNPLLFDGFALYFGILRYGSYHIQIWQLPYPHMVVTILEEKSSNLSCSLQIPLHLQLHQISPFPAKVQVPGTGAWLGAWGQVYKNTVLEYYTGAISQCYSRTPTQEPSPANYRTKMLLSTTSAKSVLQYSTVVQYHSSTVSQYHSSPISQYHSSAKSQYD